jgi:microcystin degradation protein MlrC
MKILVAGFQHETNTFAPTKATYDSFLRGEGRPPLTRGRAMLDWSDVNIPCGGFIREARRLGHEIVPLMWAAASPSAYVTQDAYERISAEILAGVAGSGYDAIYLDLHGAMVTEQCADGEGELLRRIRQAAGDAIPIAASLDLHANVTPLMLDTADILVTFRTYPHVDMAQTGARAARLLDGLKGGGTYRVHARFLPYLIPANAMCTFVSPARDVVGWLERECPGDVASIEFAFGFPAADVPGCGPTIWALGSNPQRIESVVNDMYDKLVAMESDWRVEFLTPADAVSKAKAIAAGAAKPVVIADTQDNPGAGSDANAMALAHELLAQECRDACVGMVWDPEAAFAAHAASNGAEISLSLGEQTMGGGARPLAGTFRVERVVQGHCKLLGPMMNGADVDMGQVACLRIGGVRIAVVSKKVQLYDREMLRFAGIEPERQKIIVVKSSVHFLADFEPISHAVLVAKGPGAFKADPADYHWTNLRPGIRIGPGGRSFAGDGE